MGSVGHCAAQGVDSSFVPPCLLCIIVESSRVDLRRVSTAKATSSAATPPRETGIVAVSTGMGSTTTLFSVCVYTERGMKTTHLTSGKYLVCIDTSRHVSVWD